MILIKRNIHYSIQDEDEYSKLEGRVTFTDGELTVNIQVHQKDGTYIGTGSYKYINDYNCSKTIGDCSRQNITIIQDTLERVLNFLINKFYHKNS